MNLDDGFIRVAGVGGIPSNMGWDIAWKALAPRIGVAYQWHPKTVVRAGYGRSFDIGVFGSIFGHTVTQNLPVLANQSVNNNATGTTSAAFALTAGPPANVFPTVPSDGLLPAPNYNVSVKARPNPLRLPTIDAWNLSIQQAITPTLSLTMAYVGNKSTHTLSALDGNNINPNEEAVFLPAALSINGQALHYVPSSAILPSAVNGINPDGERIPAHSCSATTRPSSRLVKARPIPRSLACLPERVDGPRQSNSTPTIRTLISTPFKSRWRRQSRRDFHSRRITPGSGPSIGL